MNVECYAATRPQDNRTVNEDAFVVQRGELPYAALCDGAGNANLAAKKALGFFQRLMTEATAARLLSEDTWTRCIRLMDSSLLGAAQSTFVGIAVVGNLAIGAYAGDSRAYVVSRKNGCRLLTAEPNRFRLGSGRATAALIRQSLDPGDILLLMSDGAWTPLAIPMLTRIVTQAALRHASDVPQAVLDAAGAKGRIDDMTVVALRFMA